jgi:VanZ family protein
MAAFLYLTLFDPALRKVRLCCAIAMYAAIVGMGSIPGARAEIGQYAPGVVLHVLAYAGLTFLLFIGYTGSGRARAMKALLTVAVMGAGDELVQSFLPYRSGTLSDWMIDCGAAGLSAALLWAFLPKPTIAP